MVVCGILLVKDWPLGAAGPVWSLVSSFVPSRDVPDVGELPQWLEAQERLDEMLLGVAEN